MAAQISCRFNKFGYCKHRDYCRKLHVNELCDESACDISNCRLRHPYTCKFYKEYGRCKFDPCAYKHIDNISVEDLKIKMKILLQNLVILNKS